MLRINTISRKIEVEDVARRWSEDAVDVLLFRVMVRRARARKMRVAVASFGKKRVIIEYLRYMLPDEDPPLLVLTAADLGLEEGKKVSDGKSSLLNLLCGAAPAIEGNKGLLFFDDSKTNVKGCRYTCTCTWVHAHTHMHTCTHAHMHMHMHMDMDMHMVMRVWRRRRVWAACFATRSSLRRAAASCASTRPTGTTSRSNRGGWLPVVVASAVA